MIPEDYFWCGPLRCGRDTGLVDRRVAPDDGDVTYEPCGFVGDPDNAPPDLGGEWEELREAWEDSRAFGDACRRTAGAGYYERLSVAGAN